MLLELDPTPRRRRIAGLTPMVDVVLLLLIFFLLAARLTPQAGLPMEAGKGGNFSGPPRLVEVFQDSVRLNGVPTTLVRLAEEAMELAPGKNGLVAVRPRGGATVQNLVDTLDALRAAGLNDLVVIK